MSEWSVFDEVYTFPSKRGWFHDFYERMQAGAAADPDRFQRYHYAEWSTAGRGRGWMPEGFRLTPAPRLPDGTYVITGLDTGETVADVALRALS